MRRIVSILLSGAFFFIHAAVQAAGPVSQAQAAVAPPLTVANQEYVFTSPPRETAEKGEEMYKPIAEMLTKATGKKFVYKYPDNWLVYQSEMRAGKYDVIFDGPHFSGWRIRQLQHTPLAKLPQPHVWVVIARADSPTIASVKDLVGRKVCVHAPPNFGTLTLQSLFDNPSRQPYLVEIKGWKEAFQGMVAKRCDGTILPVTNLKNFDEDGKLAKVIHKHQPYPNQAITAGPRITPDMRARIIDALNAPEGKAATAALRERFTKGKDLVPANSEEYMDVSLVLRNYWGFEF